MEIVAELLAFIWECINCRSCGPTSFGICLYSGITSLREAASWLSSINYLLEHSRGAFTSNLPTNSKFETTQMQLNIIEYEIGLFVSRWSSGTSGSDHLMKNSIMCGVLEKFIELCIWPLRITSRVKQILPI